mmetsp:Transcript_4185/g.6414  ORF Transcript_4185/g.6414 Transcript_4185/m.6414 type:complete len:305 (-) Transcript_4185:63-977(-)|eukprot:CAMPEP_0184359190 /NCGR_PEP_ID=MMETSP1089-20130417/118893_1 /TAXON_ID=38269 ORGANISM="Gloeochaete wittrockiana, Strain SAG46.84" /NCGR_SAMPLE_ID=MMETSP1089 /ASSEMBLY_ACC=CAM_ASM_000445 /LENGTH=304 /DNA_ID=CAMNT_0026697883 /DNA_START=120 /DNA_END=1034 /DNA_ORIENTATION=-
MHRISSLFRYAAIRRSHTVNPYSRPDQHPVWGIHESTQTAIDAELRQISNRLVAYDNAEVLGRVHSFESFDTVDGLGIRFLMFLQGCALRCTFCSQPDTWSAVDGKAISVHHVMQKIERCLPYLQQNKGGITISGGEPLLQGHFVSEVFKETKKLGLTTALDTAGIGPKDSWDLVLPHTDMVLYCFKGTSKDQYKHLARRDYFDLSRMFAADVHRRGIPMRIRYVFVPGHSDQEHEVQGVIDLALKHRSHLSCVEILPYHTLGTNKYELLQIGYALKGVPSPSKEQVHQVATRLRDAGINVLGS